MSENPTNGRVSRGALETFCIEAMRRAGMTEADARVTAEVLVRGADRIWLPGEKEWEYRAKTLAEGIALPQDVRASLQGLAEDLGIEELKTEN